MHIIRILVASMFAVTLMPWVIKTTGTESARLPIAGESQDLLPLPPFTSVELGNGVRAVLQYGPTHRITFLKGSPEVTRVTVARERLVIDKCKEGCPPNYELRLEIVTPTIVGISLSNGGIIESRGNFPLQEKINLAVSSGGTIDARSILADRITASVAEGGIILARPQTTLSASVINGGAITYWGKAQVTSSTRHGGVVVKGDPADLKKPLSESGAAVPAVLPIRKMQH